MMRLLLLLLLLPLLSLDTYAQEQQVEESEQLGKWEYFQIFLSNPVEEINYLQYENDGTPIEHELSEDGTSIFIQGYDGTSKIQIGYTGHDGKRGEFLKSSCHVHPTPPT